MLASPEQVAHRYYELFNARRLDETELMIGPEALFHYPSFSQHLVGPAGHRALSQVWLTAFPDLELQILRARPNGNGSIAMLSFARGTHEGPLRLGPLDVPPTGRRIRIEYQHVLKVEEGRIIDVSLQLDLQDLLQQLQSPA